MPSSKTNLEKETEIQQCFARYLFKMTLYNRAVQMISHGISTLWMCFSHLLVETFLQYMCIHNSRRPLEVLEACPVFQQLQLLFILRNTRSRAAELMICTGLFLGIYGLQKSIQPLDGSRYRKLILCH